MCTRHLYMTVFLWKAALLIIGRVDKDIMAVHIFLCTTSWMNLNNLLLYERSNTPSPQTYVI